MAEYLKWIKATLTCAADSTLYSVDIPMPVQRGQGRGMNLAVVIHRIEWEHANDLSMADNDFAQCYLTKSTPASTPTMATADLLFMANKQKNLDTNGSHVDVMPYVTTYNPPLLVPNEKLVFSAAHNIGSSTAFAIRIGYTIRSISQDEMYAALNNQ